MIGEPLLVFLILFGCLIWLFNTVAIILAIKTIPKTENMKADTLTEWPLVSVIIPACNESDTLEEAMRTRLRTAYPNIEFILIDDRSTDGTSEIVRRLAAEDKRIVPVFITELPEGWLGKLWALEKGVQKASGEWFLFTDADVHLQRGILRKVIGYCEKGGLDHLAVLPGFRTESFFLDVALGHFLRGFTVLSQGWAANNPKSKKAAGVGAFNLVRRFAYEKTEGFEWLRLDPIDDIGLAVMLRESGARGVVVNGNEEVYVKWYRNLREYIRGIERATFSGFGNYSFLRSVSIGLLSLLEISHFLCFLPSAPGWTRLPGIAAVIVSFVASAVINRWYGRPVFPALCYPLGLLFNVFGVFRAGLMGALRGGIYWRGTFYPSKLLKNKRRIKLI